MIERVVRHRDMRGQFEFAAHAKNMVPQDERFVLAKSNRGLHVFARDEDALALPLGALRGAFGPRLQVNEERRGEAIMEMRLGLERRYLAEVRKALLRRGLDPTEEYLGLHYCVLRLEARLPELLGLPREVARLTSGKASQQIVLSRYAGRRSA